MDVLVFSKPSHLAFCVIAGVLFELGYAFFKGCFAAEKWEEFFRA